jgi:hypothetical protein
MINAADLLTQLSQHLQQYEDYWRFNAFHQNPNTIQSLLKKLVDLDENRLWQIDNNPAQQAEFFNDYFPEIFSWQNTHAPHQLAAAQDNYPFWLKTSINGRKWTQINQFIDALPKAQAAIEWCAGKGHLGKAYSWQHKSHITSIEWQLSLCQQGQTEANKLALNQDFINADIHQLPLENLSTNTSPKLWLALHACGDLHREFIRQASQHRAHHLALAPCCYHRQSADYYQPLSKIGLAQNLLLNHQDLRLAQQNQITAGLSERKQRAQLLNWRLGYEALRHALMPNRSAQQSAYQTLPSIKNGQFKHFSDFCVWASQRHGIALPRPLKFEDYEQQGHIARLHMMQRDAIRHCFRRPLELWLLLDKAAYLQEQDYRIQWHQFCDAKITPRNLLLLAWKK